MSSYSHFSNGFITPSSSSASNVASSAAGNTSVTSIPLPSPGGGGAGGYHTLPPKFMPSLRMKTNELFYRWFSEPERYEQIKEIVHFIKSTGKMPKPSDLQTFKTDPNTSYGRSVYPQSTASHLASAAAAHDSHSQHQQQFLAQQQMYLQAPKSHHHRSKSPPSLQSPPMSPISRMPNSPKSPRQRQNMMMLNQNNNNNSNNGAGANANGSNAASSALNTNGSGRANAGSNLNYNRLGNAKTTTASSINNRETASPVAAVNSRENVNFETKTTKSGDGYAQQASTTSGSATSTSAKSFGAGTSGSGGSSPVLGAKNQPRLDKESPRSSPLATQNENTRNKSNPDAAYSSTSNKSNTDLAAQQLLYNAAAGQQQQQQQPGKSAAASPNEPAGLKQATTFNSPSSPTPASAVKSIGSAITNFIKMPNNRVQQQKLTPQLSQQLNVPQFYFPNGKPDEKQFKDAEDAETMRLASAEFRNHKDGKMFKEDFVDILKIVGLPRYWKILLFRSCTNSTKLNYVVYSTFEQVWTKLTAACNDRASLFMKMIAPAGGSVTHEDWEPLMQDIVDTHPGLKFLHDHKEFHTRYIKTVIARIYYTVNRSWSGRITLAELRKSNFLSVLESLDHEEDINLIKDYFSYEHFYVIYCKFWELDKDHDLLISKEDLYRHNNYAISPRVIDRIFSGTVIRSKDWRDGLMSYYDFVWFLISEEDKRNPTSIEYWFRILDLDGDGVLSMYELEYFYNEQIEQMRERQIEYMPFNDLLCQILDLVKPIEPGKIRLKDLKQCKMSNVFFDTFVNLEKYLEYEQRDPFSNIRDLDGPEQSDWEKYATDEYENLVSEDVNGEAQECYNNYEDDFDDEPLIFNSMNMKNGGAYPGQQPLGLVDDANGFIKTNPGSNNNGPALSGYGAGVASSNAANPSLATLLDSLTSNMNAPSAATALIDTNLNGGKHHGANSNVQEVPHSPSR